MQPETRQALIAWMRQFGVTLLIYLAMLAASLWALTSQAAGPTRTALVVAPALPGLALIWLTVRWYRRCDEFIRLRVLQAAAVSAVAVAVFELVYFFLELLGLPRLSSGWISNLIWAVFVIQMLWLVATGK